MSVWVLRKRQCVVARFRYCRKKVEGETNGCSEMKKRDLSDNRVTTLSMVLTILGNDPLQHGESEDKPSR